MRIIEVISDTNIGGAGVLLCERLSCENPLRGSTLVLLPRGSALTARLRRAGVTAVEISVEPDKSFCLSDVKKYMEMFRAYRPHIVNTHASLSARIAAFLCGVSVKICTRHCVFPSTVCERILMRPSALLCDRFIAVADCVREQLIELGVPSCKINVVVNGARRLRVIDDNERKKIRAELNIPAEAAVLIICARLEKCKGHECLLRALRLLHERGEKVFALIVGSGSEGEQLKTEAKRLDLQKTVRFFGFCDDVAPYYNIANININCSTGTETSSLSLSEGMSIGLPSVVSDYGGNPYMVRHGENGFVYKQGSAQELAGYISRLINDRELYKKMSDAALKRYVTELDINRSTQKTNAIYRECLSAYRKRKSKI